MFLNWCLSQLQKTVWQFKDSLPSILNCEGCFDHLKANYFWHQSFVLPLERLSPYGREERLVWWLVPPWTSFPFSVLAPAFSGLVFVELVCFMICTIKNTPWKLPTNFSYLRYRSPRVKRERYLMWDLVVGTPRPGTGVEIQELGKGYKKLYQWCINKKIINNYMSLYSNAVCPSLLQPPYKNHLILNPLKGVYFYPSFYITES